METLEHNMDVLIPTMEIIKRIIEEINLFLATMGIIRNLLVFEEQILVLIEILINPLKDMAIIITIYVQIIRNSFEIFGLGQEIFKQLAWYARKPDQIRLAFIRETEPWQTIEAMSTNKKAQAQLYKIKSI